MTGTSPHAIRPAADRDIDGIVAAFQWLFDPPGATPDAWNPRTAARRLHELSRSDRGELFIAELDASLAGFATVYLDLESVRYGQRAWLNDIAVDPHARSHGIGAALFTTAQDWARDHGATMLALDSGADRHDAHRVLPTSGTLV